MRVSVSFNLNCLIDRLRAVHIPVTHICCICFDLIRLKKSMDKFDSFNLVFIQNTQQFLKLSSINETTMYTLHNSPINNNKLKKNQHELNKNRTVQSINYSAKNYTDIKNRSTKLSTITIS